MYLQTLTAILSAITIGLLEGIDPHKGLLFSYYFFKFRKVKISLLAPIIITICYYSLGLILSFTLDPTSSINVKIVVTYFLILHSLLKLFLGRILHYSGSMKPNLMNVIKWSFVNSVIQMEFIPVFCLFIFLKFYSILILFLVNIISREITFMILKDRSEGVLRLTRVNMNALSSITILILGIALLLTTLI